MNTNGNKNGGGSEDAKESGAPTHIEAELRRSEEMLQLALATSEVGTWDWVVGDDRVTWGENVHAVFGVNAGELGPKYEDFLQRVHEDDRDAVQEAVGRALAAADANYECCYRVRWPNGELHTILAKGKVYRDTLGEPCRMFGMCWDVTSDSVAEANRAYLAAIVESSNDAIFSASIDGTITSWNQGAEQLYGYTVEEAIGQSILMLIPTERRTEYETFVAAITKGEVIERMDTERIKKSGARISVSQTKSPIVDQEGNLLGVSVIARDITRILQADRELRESHKSLQRINEELEQFTYVASHDLREPLRTVRSFCELLAEKYRDQLGNEANQWIDFVVDGTKRMQAMIDDLLAYSRLDSSGPPEPTDCALTVQNVLADLQIAINNSKATVRVGDLPIIAIEPSQLHQLFQNLISNAIKYRSHAPPQITVSVEPIGGEWRFCIADNGIGMKSEHCTKVFDLFRRLNSREEYEGNGIGLSVCRKIVQRRGGEIWVESKLGEGSSFYFTLPRNETETP